MTIAALHPCPALLPFVRQYVVIQGVFEERHTARITPKGSGAIGFPFGEPFAYAIEPQHIYAGDVADQPMLIGQINTSGMALYRQAVRFLFVALQPTGIYHLLRQAASVCNNRIVTTDDLYLPTYFREAQERLWGVQDPAAVVRAVEPYLLRFFKKIPEHALLADITPMAAVIERSAGAVKVEALAEKFRITPRWLEKQFTEQVGLSPKQYARIVRFQQMMHYAVTRPQVVWTDLAYRFGYADQSHLIKDFQRFTGLSPSHIFEENAHFDRLLHQSLLAPKT
jgi:AraC-like DNA-binding protein